MGQLDSTQPAYPTQGASTLLAERPTTATQPWARVLDWPALALLVIGMGLRIWLIIRGWPTLDSDEAIIGLMGRHILYNGEHPTFYYGQHYMGALEAYLVVPFFWLLGPTQVALRLAMLTLIMPFLFCMYLLGRAAYGRMVGLLTLAALAVGPAYGLMREAPAIGGYQETLLFGAFLAWLAYLRLRAPTDRVAGTSPWRRVSTYAAFGLIAGLGVWADELILVFIVAPLLALLLARRRELLSLPVMSALAGGFLIGAAPFLRFNLLSRGRTFVELSLQESAGHLGLHQLLSQIGSTLSIAVPATFGSPQVCVEPGSVYAGYASYPASAVRAVTLGACQATNVANMVFAAAILGVYALAATPLLRVALHWLRAPLSARHRLGAYSHSAARDALETPTLPRRAVSSPGTDSVSDTQRAAQLWLRGMLILAALGSIAEYSLSRRTVGPDQFVAVRYLLPLYVTLPVVIGPLWEVCAAGWKRLRWPDGSGMRPRAGFAAAGLALLLGLFASSGIQATITATDTSRFALPAARDQHLITTLRSLGITAYYGDYWTCYNIVFDSGERLHCSTYPRVERYPPYAKYLGHVTNPAYLLLAGSVDDVTFQQERAPALYRAGYQRLVVNDVAIYFLPGATG